MWVLLEKYLASSTHSWQDWRKMFEEENPTACSSIKTGTWETVTRIYRKSEGKLKYSIKVVILLCLASLARAYTVVQISTGAPVGTESQFLDATAAQFNATVTPNPLAANTYAVKIYGPNPSYNAPVTAKQIFDGLIAVSTYNYVYGWTDGESYQQSVDTRQTEDFVTQCSSPSVFVDTATFMGTWDSDTCQNAVWTVYNALFSMHLSTPTTVPGEFQ